MSVKLKEPVKAEASCGCPFCDLGIEPDATDDDGRPVHTFKGSWTLVCRRAILAQERTDGR